MPFNSPPQPESPLSAYLHQARDAYAQAHEQVERLKMEHLAKAAGMTPAEVIANIDRFHMVVSPYKQAISLDGKLLVTFTEVMDEIEVKVHVRGVEP